MMTAMVLCIVVASAAVYTYATQNQNRKDIENIAIEFLVNGPTFSFDGVPESVKVLEKYVLESYPEQHIVVLSFNTTHCGWGNREGTFIAPAITPHLIRITIVEGEVIEAVIDEKWDEVNQEQIIPEELLVLEEARDKAVQYIIEKYPELGLEVPDAWISEVLTPSGILGASTIRYIGDDWDITLSYAVVQYPDYEVSINYSGEASFTWTGVVYSTGVVSETSMIQ